MVKVSTWAVLVQVLFEVRKRQLVAVFKTAVAGPVLLHCVVSKMNEIVIEISLICRVLSAARPEVALPKR